MNNIIRCHNCGTTIGHKYFEFKKDYFKLPEDQRNIDNKILFEKYNITRLCCKILMITAMPDILCREKLSIIKDDNNISSEESKNDSK